MMMIKVPGAVWYDYLDPSTTGMEAALGLDKCSNSTRSVGKGVQIVYANVPDDAARELSEYLEERARLLLAQDDDGLRHAHYRAIELADSISAQLGRGGRR